MVEPNLLLVQYYVPDRDVISHISR